MYFRDLTVRELPDGDCVVRHVPVLGWMFVSFGLGMWILTYFKDALWWGVLLLGALLAFLLVNSSRLSMELRFSATDQ